MMRFLRVIQKWSSWRCVFPLAALSLGMVVVYGWKPTLSAFFSHQSVIPTGQVQLLYEDDTSIIPANQQSDESACSLPNTVRKLHRFPQIRFNFSTPVFQWAGSFTEKAYQRLRLLAPPYGWMGIPPALVRSTLGLLSSPTSGHLVERRSPDQCLRCAVVGNGGILRGSGQGRDIDDHDLVFRVNGAVIQGFERDVGTKTSFYGFTVNTMKHSLVLYHSDGFTRVPQGPDTRYIFIPSNIRDYVMMASAIRREYVPTGVDFGDRPKTYFGNSSREHFRMLHPDFISYLTEHFLKSHQLTDSKMRHLYMPSTGALMLFAALHTCDQVSAYGFITTNYAAFSDHYYDSVMTPLRFYANHDLRMEGLLWELLHHQKIIQLYTREH
ncbi:alpha-N-acetylgalactosaminide alpha-2,6-sialyltransferase 2 [Gadus morhua]|uniref:alpha-N-acetylgalactosaminide alpha-2,6-sialyltransferase n=1 Tax=Gadus morhua TaxID=8049 RepID=A0A8C5FLC0_GADMO|nr:alpha-N-acetylgalactosaminide alpha-2,6-sialyltransferase 2-like [Gadus morhua]